MAGTITWMTGFNRNLPFNSVDYSGTLYRDETIKRTGQASLRLESDTSPGEWVRRRISGSPSNPSVSVAVYAQDYFSTEINGLPKVMLRTPEGAYLELRWNYDSHTMDLYSENTLRASGTIEVSVNDWFHVQWFVDPTGNKIQVKIDGHLSIDYEYLGGVGYDYCYLVGGQYGLTLHNDCHFDDWVIGYGDFFGDVRIEELVPNSDGTVQWDRSEGAANYETVDETPESDTDYNYTRVNGEYDQLGVGDFVATDPVTGANKEVLAAMAWVRSRVDVATGEHLKVGAKSGATLSATTHAQAYAYEVYEHIMQVNPDDSQPWEEADLDAILLHYEAVLGA